jgi:hypothetical protein
MASHQKLPIRTRPQTSAAKVAANPLLMKIIRKMLAEDSLEAPLVLNTLSKYQHNLAQADDIIILVHHLMRSCEDGKVAWAAVCQSHWNNHRQSTDLANECRLKPTIS